MSAFGIALPVPTTTCSERCGSQCSVSRCQLSFSDAGQMTTAGNASSSSSAASASTVLPRPCSSAMNSRRDSSAYATPGALERPQLAAEARSSHASASAVGGARAADGADRRVVLDRAAARAPRARWRRRRCRAGG